MNLRDRVLDRAQLGSLPRPAPLISRTLDLGTVAVLAGYWGTMKSFIALDWAASIATGRPWQDRDTRQARVLYVAAEGAYGLHDRLNAWEQGWGQVITPESLNVLPDPVHLGNEGDVLSLAELIRDEQYRFVVIDTLAKCITGMDENSARDMGVAVASLYTLQRATSGGNVTALHHTGKDKATIRGSSALEAGVDTVYTTEGDSLSLKLSRTKRKDGPREDVLNLKFEPIEGSGSGVVSSARGSLRNAASAESLISHFRAHFSATGAFKSEIVNSVVEAGVMSTASAYRALNALVEAGSLANHGTEQRPFYRLGE